MKSTLDDNRLSSTRIMEETKINQTQIEINTWKRLLNFFRDENVCLKSQSYQDVENKIWYMLDCDKLAQSKEFTIPYET